HPPRRRVASLWVAGTWMSPGRPWKEKSASEMAKVNHPHSHPVVAKAYAGDAARPSAPQGQGANDAHPIVLTARDWEALLAAWDDSDRPRPRLEALVQRYRNCRGAS